jgi:dephospho-CoA kinase
VIAVIAPVALQIARLMAARGWSEAEARQRLARARSNQAFADVADEVIVNDGSEAEAAAAARAALARLSAKRAGAGA